MLNRRQQWRRVKNIPRSPLQKEYLLNDIYLNEDCNNCCNCFDWFFNNKNKQVTFKNTINIEFIETRKELRPFFLWDRENNYNCYIEKFKLRNGDVKNYTF